MRILFVCTGNTCRSPMAEGMFRQMAKEAGLQVEVRSAGVAAAPGMSMTKHAEAVLRDSQIEDRLTSTPLTSGLTEWADLILALTQSHKRQIIYTFPSASDKTFVLKEYVQDAREFQELDALLADKALQAAIGGKLSGADHQRLLELSQQMPNFDIADPFGGGREDYDRTAAEIRSALSRLLEKLKDLIDN